MGDGTEGEIHGECDCCGKTRNLTHCWAYGIETYACWECRGWDFDPYAEDDEERYRHETGAQS